ncbi:MAG TPA: glycosyltransferase [Solirubrobacteraceae bacterium]|nr:glycosyltransferase [Solirubrobacteraceae bacterium]
MSTPDVTLISPFPALGERHGGFTGVASYSANLAAALDDAGARVTVLAAHDPNEPAVATDGTLEVRRVWKRGPGALPGAAAAALATGAPAVHVQHELFLYGGPSAVPGIVPALAALRRRNAVVTMHHVVDPKAVDAGFTATHRVRAPAPVARAGVAAVQRTIAALADTVVVHEPSFAHVVPGAQVVPHGVETPERGDREAARAALGVDGFCVLCFGFLAPYKGLEAALGAARLAGEDVELVIAGGEHPRLAGDGYADALRAAAPANVRFAGYVADADVARWFAAADVALLPYPQPFASSGPLALALAHGTPVLLSDALAGTVGAPDELAVPADPAAIAARLDALAADRGDRERLRAAAATLAAGRSWPEVARRHLDLYGSPG